MNKMDLVSGLMFAYRHELTSKEIEVLIPFLGKDLLTTQELSDTLKKNKTTLYNLVQRLKLKQLVVLKDRDDKGTNYYEFNTGSLLMEKVD